MSPFGLFSSRIVTVNGKQMTVKHQRELEKIDVQKKRDAAEKARVLGELEVTKQVENHKETKTEKIELKKSSRAAAVRKGVANWFSRLFGRLDRDRPLLAALIQCGTCMFATFVGQVMVYTALNWHGFGFMALVLPVIVEGATWTCAIYAQWLATRADPLPYGSEIRLMWLFASYAAASNTYHIAVELKDPITGALLGGASIVGPLLWHRYIGLAKKSRSGGGDRIRITFRRRIHYPFITWRAGALWSAAGGAMTRDRAWLETYRDCYGCYPGQQPVHESVTYRNQWLWRIVRPLVKREVNPVVFRGAVVVVASADQRADGNADQRADRDADQLPRRPAISATSAADQRADEGADETADPRGLGPADVPLLALAGGPVGFDISADLAPYEEAFAEWERSLNQRADRDADGPLISAQNGRPEAESAKSAPAAPSADQRADGDGGQRADGDADTGADDTADDDADRTADERPQPRGKRGRRGRGSARGNKRPDLQKLVEKYYDNQRAAGVPMDKITGPAAAVATGASEQYARGILADKKRAEQKRVASETAKK